MAKVLTEEEVVQIKSMIFDGVSVKSIANAYSVGTSTISDIKTGKTWTEPNEAILLFGDVHGPYHHKDALPFLAAVKKAVNPTMVYSLGDELDSHALSFYPTEIDLDNATRELEHGRAFIQELAGVFPKVTCLESNHTSRVYRQGRVAGIPKELILPYEDILGVRKFNWNFVKDATVKLPNGEDVFLVHNAGSNCMVTSGRLGMSVVAGHVHSKAFIQNWRTSVGNHFAMQVGCLIDDNSSAFNYNVANIVRPQLGCAAIIDSKPILIEMGLTSEGRWDGCIQT